MLNRTTGGSPVFSREDTGGPPVLLSRRFSKPTYSSDSPYPVARAVAAADNTAAASSAGVNGL